MKRVRREDGDVVSGQIQLDQVSHGEENGVFDERDVVAVEHQSFEAVQTGKDASFQARQLVALQLEIGQFGQSLESERPDVADLRKHESINFQSPTNVNYCFCRFFSV